MRSRKTVYRDELLRLGSATQLWVHEGMPAVVMTAPEIYELQWAHARTNVSFVWDGDGGCAYRALGSTMWIAVPEGDAVVLTFDWALVDHRALLVHNPLAIGSNLVVVNDQRRQCRPTERVVVLSDLAYRIKWQAKVREHLPREILVA